MKSSTFFLPWVTQILQHEHSLNWAKKHIANEVRDEFSAYTGFKVETHRPEANILPLRLMSRFTLYSSRLYKRDTFVQCP